MTIAEFLMSLPDSVYDYSVNVEIFGSDPSIVKEYDTLISFIMRDNEIIDNYNLDDIIIVMNPGKCHFDININNVSSNTELDDKDMIETVQTEAFTKDARKEEMEKIDYKNLPWLVRKSTEEYIYIIKEFFIIGKSKTHADYAIERNTAISREHCTFIRSGKLTYIRDNNSTNGTYVNGIKLNPGKRVLLNDGMRINLANEEFIFKTKRQ
jgi:hypothetical protein